MKRILIVAAIVAAAAPAASSADSAGKATSARGGDNFSLKFDVVSVGGDPKRIENFKYRNFTVSCAVGGPFEVDGSFGKMGINDAGKFDGTVRKGDGKIHVEGELKKGKRVVGILKSSGDFGSGSQNCKTTLGWKAS